MRLSNTVVLVGSMLLLASCQTGRDSVAGRDVPDDLLDIRSRAAKTALTLATPAMIRDCSDKVAAAFPDVKPTGPYGFSPNAATALAELDAKLLTGDRFAVLAAPTTIKGSLGQEVKSVVGCSTFLKAEGSSSGKSIRQRALCK